MQDRDRKDHDVDNPVDSPRDGPDTGNVARAALTVPLPAVLVGLGLMASPSAQAQGVAVDDHYVTPINTPLIGRNVTSNDDLVANATVQVLVADSPQHGTVAMTPNGQFNYTPDTNFQGVDSFRYDLIDDGNSIATVFIAVGEQPAIPALGGAGIVGLSAALAGLAMRRRRKG